MLKFTTDVCSHFFRCVKQCLRKTAEVPEGIQTGVVDGIDLEGTKEERDEKKRRRKKKKWIDKWWWIWWGSIRTEGRRIENLTWLDLSLPTVDFSYIYIAPVIALSRNCPQEAIHCLTTGSELPFPKTPWKWNSPQGKQQLPYKHLTVKQSRENFWHNN